MAWKKKGSGLVSQPINQPGVSPNPVNPGDQPQGPYAPQNFTMPSTAAPRKPGAGPKATGSGMTSLPVRKPKVKAKAKGFGPKKKSGLFGEL